MKNDWLKEYLQGIDSKVTETANAVKAIQKTQGDILRDSQRNWDAYKGLYGDFENHTLTKCPPIIKHENADHKGLAGKILLYASIILTSEGIIIGAVWYLATHIPK